MSDHSIDIERLKADLNRCQRNQRILASSFLLTICLFSTMGAGSLKQGGLIQRVTALENHFHVQICDGMEHTTVVADAFIVPKVQGTVFEDGKPIPAKDYLALMGAHCLPADLDTRPVTGRLAIKGPSVVDGIDKNSIGHPIGNSEGLTEILQTGMRTAKDGKLRFVVGVDGMNKSRIDFYSQTNGTPIVADFIEHTYLNPGSMKIVTGKEEAIGGIASNKTSIDSLSKQIGNSFQTSSKHAFVNTEPEGPISYSLLLTPRGEVVLRKNNANNPNGWDGQKEIGKYP